MITEYDKIDKAAFDAILENNKDNTILVDVYGVDCPPCSALARELPKWEEPLKTECKIDQIIKIKVDANPWFEMAYTIKAVPTLLVFSGQKELGRVIGVRGKVSLIRDIMRIKGAS